MGKFYLTAAIPYVNAKPHLGHALEFVESDVIARYRKAKGDDVCFASGADENSLKNVQAAEAEGISVQELCDRNSAAFQALVKTYNVALDVFQRSSSPEHFASSQDLWRRCEEGGDIYKKTYEGLYCVGCEAFYTKEELDENGECFEHPGKKLEIVKEENYFFRLSRYQQKLEDLIESGTYHILPEHRRREALEFIRGGLQDFSVSRAKERAHGWGVPISDDPSQIMYVWFDALNVYRSAAPGRWPADLHVIGKGILRFHAIYWPAILLSAKLELPKNLFVHGYITVDGKKMSKTIGNVLDPIDLVKKYGVDPIRYYLLREIPTTEDGDFSEAKFKERYNGDLANGLGNFTARVLALGAKRGVINPNVEVDQEVHAKIEALRAEVYKKIEAFKLHEALGSIWELVSFGDEYVNREKPWETNSEQVIFSLIVILDNIAGLLEPFLPETAGNITKSIAWQDRALTVKKGDTLFPRI